MIRMKKAFALLLLAALLAGCQSARKAQAVYITDSAALHLFSPEDVGEPIEDYQLIFGSYGGNEFMAEAYLIADRERLDITLLAAGGGQTICSIAWDGSSLEFSSPFMPAGSVAIEYAVMDLQLAIYSDASVREKVEASGLSYASLPSEDGYERMIHDGENLVWKAEKREGRLMVENVLRGYSYEVESLQ